MDEKLRILLCEDDESLGMLLREYLQAKNYDADLCLDGEAGYRAFCKNQYNMCVLDVMMPRKDGFQLAHEIRALNPEMPIIFLTAKNLKEDVFEGFRIGADDYITKPFNPLEVAARVNSQLRRYNRFGAAVESESYVVGGIELNDRRKEVTVDGEAVSLTPKEYDILKLLISNPDRVYSPKEIYTLVWRENPLAGNDNTVAVHIRHLREKIEINPNEPRYIKVIFGKGYKMEKGRTK